MLTKFFSILICLFLTLGCSSTNATTVGITTANEVREIAVEENKIITNYCVPKYRAAQNLKDVEEADKVCLPAKISYHAVRAAWIALVLVLEKAKISDTDYSAEIQDAALQLTQTLDNLHQILETMK
jgi:hypothetical protein